MVMKQFKISNTITARNTDSIAKYLQDMSRYEIVTPEKEAEIAFAYKNNPKNTKAREKLITSNLRFVISVAKHYQTQGVELEDLINEGNIGLLKAADHYDPSTGFKFISYAVWWIRQSIQQYIDTQTIIRTPGNYNALRSKYRTFQTKFLQEEGRLADYTEFAEVMGLSTKREIDALKHMQMTTVSLDKPIADDPGADSLGSTIASEADTSYLCDESDMQSDVKFVLEKVLTAREYKVVTEFLGINTHSVTIDEIASDMNLSRERVRQLYVRSISKLQRSEQAKQILRSYLS